MSTATPTARDSVLDEALRLAVDLAELLVDFREQVGPAEAFRLSQVALDLPERCRRARESVTSEKAREHLAAASGHASTLARGLEGLAERRRIPLLQSLALHRRLRSLAGALAAMGEPHDAPGEAAA